MPRRVARKRRSRGLPPRPPAYSGPLLKPAEFLARHAVFRFDEFAAMYVSAGHSRRTAASTLRYHVRSGNLCRLRRGLFARQGSLDPWVLGSRLSADAVLAYDGALSFHQLSGLGYGMSFLTRERVQRFVYNEVVYQPVAVPAALCRYGDFGDGVMEAERGGQRLRVTTPERTLVDLLDRLDLSQGPLALWRSFKKVKHLDVERLVHHAWRLENRAVAARLGFLLAHRPDITSKWLFELKPLKPRSPCYFARARRASKMDFVPEWNLIVPRELLLLARYGEKALPPGSLDPPLPDL